MKLKRIMKRALVTILIMLILVTNIDIKPVKADVSYYIQIGALSIEITPFIESAFSSIYALMGISFNTLNDLRNTIKSNAITDTAGFLKTYYELKAKEVAGNMLDMIEIDISVIKDAFSSAIRAFGSLFKSNENGITLSTDNSDIKVGYLNGYPVMDYATYKALDYKYHYASYNQTYNYDDYEEYKTLYRDLYLSLSKFFLPSTFENGLAGIGLSVINRVEPNGKMYFDWTATYPDSFSHSSTVEYSGANGELPVFDYFMDLHLIYYVSEDGRIFISDLHYSHFMFSVNKYRVGCRLGFVNYPTGLSSALISWDSFSAGVTDTNAFQDTTTYDNVFNSISQIANIENIANNNTININVLDNPLVATRENVVVKYVPVEDLEPEEPTTEEPTTEEPDNEEVNFLDYINPNSDKFFLKLALIPRKEFLQEQFDGMKGSFDDRIPILSQMIEIVQQIDSTYKNVESDIAPEFTITLPDKYGGQKLKILDLQYFTQYRSLVHGFITVFAVYFFIRRVLKKMPNIIHI